MSESEHNPTSAFLNSSENNAEEPPIKRKTLFAAYRNVADAEKVETQNAEWCNLGSFVNDPISSIELPKDPKSIDIEPVESKKHKKHKKQKHSDSPPPEHITIQTDDEPFKIDVQRTTGYLSVDTITRPAAPKYHVVAYFALRNAGKSRKFKRYFRRKNTDNQDLPEETITKADLDKDMKKSSSDVVIDASLSADVKEEQELRDRTADFNRRLGADPANIDLWLQYVDFQDVRSRYEKAFKKGSLAKAQRVTAERKVSILDKAIAQNPDQEHRLHRKRLEVLVAVYPSDELQVELKRLVEKDDANIILWQGYIEATQCSMSHCNIPAVLDLYIKCLHKLHTLRRVSKLSQTTLEENILRVLYQCGLFLRQAGLFEHMWTLLRLYLKLNLPDSAFASDSHLCDERQLLALEETVLASQLPIHELWLRMEKLREASHWMPINLVDRNATSEDPQRMVFSDDVTDLIHPITVPGNTFTLTVTILNLLKLPLLPMRHTTLRDLRLDFVPWSLDSVENLLSALVPQHTIDVTNRHLLEVTQKLTVGPQYTRTLPGQEEYLRFLQETVSSCANCLSGDEKVAINIWWFRFNGMLAILENHGSCKLLPPLKKQLRASLKNTLKTDRDNIALYNEYALVEHQSGNTTSALNVINTALSAYVTHAVSSVVDTATRAGVSAAYRTLIELEMIVSDTIISDAAKSRCIAALTRMALGSDDDSVTKALIAFRKNSLHMAQQSQQGGDTQLKLVHHFVPNAFTDWVICNMWLVYLQNGIDDAQKLYDDVYVAMGDDGAASHQGELLAEFRVSLIYRHACNVTGWFGGWSAKFEVAIMESLALFPTNQFLLALLATYRRRLKLNAGLNWWKVRNQLLASGHTMSNVFVLLIEHEAIISNAAVRADDLNFNDYSMKNRMLNLFSRLIKIPISRRCPLIWRLYLQFLHAHSDPKTCRDVYYLAVEELPWLKALYIDAAIYIPEELVQIQDLIIEKQLRLHVTPEELDILRV